MPPDPIILFAQTATDLDALSDALGSGGVTGFDWLRAGAVFIIAVVASRIAKAILRRVLCRQTDAAVADLIARLIAYVIAILGLIYALEQVDVRVGPLLGALGIIGIAVAFALKDILENFVAGLLLQFRRPFSYGDQIQSGDIEGTVQSIDARSVTVRTPDGETVHLPSSQVITDAIVNHTEGGARRTTIPLGVAYGTNLRRARGLLLDAVKGTSGVHPDPTPEVLLTGFGDSSIDFVVRFWHDPSIADHWQIQDAVAFALHDVCDEHGIEIPFPQRTLWMASSSSNNGAAED